MTRPHGDAQIDARSPRALAICQRCGFMKNHDTLRWQWDWLQGPRLFNLRILVCEECYDVPQENGRTVVLPPDPIPIANPWPEDYVGADNPVSALNWSPLDNFIAPVSSLGGNIGNLTLNGGLDSAFMWNAQSSAINSTSVTGLFSGQTQPLVNKRFAFCAALPVSNSSYQNFVGKNWNALPSGIGVTLPSTVAPTQHIASGFTAWGPNDQPFLRTGATGWQFQGSNDNATWFVIGSGTTAGTKAEALTVSTTSATPYAYHRLALQGDGISQIGVAGLSISISDAAPNDI